ncbi:MAG: hypothetical protein R2880_18665 [Deinococcales bacterium]
MLAVLSLLATGLVACGNIADTIIPTVNDANSLAAGLQVTSITTATELSLTDGDEVLIEAYNGDPTNGGTLLGSSTIIYGETSLHTAIHDLIDSYTSTTYIVISANSQSQTIALSSLRGRGGRGHHGSAHADIAILDGLADGTTVNLSLYDGDPANGGTEVVSSSYVTGESSFRTAFKALLDSAADATFSYLLVTVGTESSSVALPEHIISETSIRNFLAALSDGDTVNLSLYSGDPANGGTEVASSSYVIGETSFHDALRSLRQATTDTYDYLLVSSGSSSLSVAIGSEGAGHDHGGGHRGRGGRGGH